MERRVYDRSKLLCNRRSLQERRAISAGPMKILRFASPGGDRLGLIAERGVVDLTTRLEGAPDDTIGLIAEWGRYETSLRALEQLEPDHELADITLLSPIKRPGKTLAVGMNYVDHVKEIGGKVPEHQLWFMKPSSAINGPSGEIQMPLGSVELDYEAELVLVVGKTVRAVDVSNAAEAIFGYCVGNDVSVRDRQFETSQFLLGKGGDTHAPIGPWITTRDVARIENGAIRSFVNNEMRQSSRTGNMIFPPESLVSCLSQVMTLEPGDIIFTGTPAGVGMGFNPPRWLQKGDVVRVEIEGLGSLENRVVDYVAGPH